jgi:predicted Zn-dependent protease with MMP-like domain
MPTRIILFQKTIEEDYDDPAEVVKCIQDTVIHEIGHWFGEDEEDLDRLGLG